MNPARWPVSGQLLLAFAAGGATVSGFAPHGLGLVPLLTLSLLFHLWRRPARAGLNAWTGYAFGLGLMGFGVFWIRISIAQFGGVTPALAVAITLLFVVAMAAYFALAGWLGERLRPASDVFWLALVLPGVWVLVEWLRGWLFTGFPWLALGYAQIDLPPGGYAPLLGVYGISLVLAVSAGLLNLAAVPPTASARPMRLFAAGAIALLWGGGLGLGQLQWTRPAADPIRVSLLQGNIPQAQKWQRSMRTRSLNLYLEMTASVPDSRIVIWPETAVPAFASEVEADLLAPLHTLLRKQGRDVLLGVVDGERDGDYFNAMLSLGASGRDHYHKRHLVPFGEYLPFDRWTRPVLDFLKIPMSDFAAGDDGSPVVRLAGQPVGIDICYEDAYAEEVLRALPQATLLINASNDAWFGDSLAPHQHLEIARMRARETGRYLLRATNTGISAIIDPRGGLRGTAPQFEKGVLTDDVQPLLGATPFVRWGNAAVVLIAVLMVLTVTRRPKSR